MNAPQIQARPIPDLYRRFQPWMIPGLGLDLDASYGVLNSIGPDVPATNGQSVRRWLDKSGNGNNFDQSTASLQPILNSGYVIADGMDDFMDSSAILGMLNGAPGVTSISVARPDSLSSGNHAIYRATIGGGVAARVQHYRLSSVVRLGVRRPDGGGLTIVSATADYVASAAAIQTSIVDFSTQVMRSMKDGGNIGSELYPTAGTFAPTDSQNWSIFSANGVSEFWDGGIARLLVWPRALTAPELAQVHAYLSQTYGIPLAS